MFRRLNLASRFDEDQRFVGEREGKKGVASPIGRLQPPAQVVRALDHVDGFVADDPLQDVGRPATTR